ncbi:MAG: hypothetical protein AB2L07_12515 [Thermoanaerobaculaceae bacterium]
MRVGDMVDVTGKVKEYYSLTEITSPAVTVTSSGNPPSCACGLGRVAAVAGATAARHRDRALRGDAGPRGGGHGLRGRFDLYGELAAVARPTRSFREKGRGPTRRPPASRCGTATRRCFLVKPTGLGLPDAQVPAGVPFSAVGPLYYSFDQYKILPTSFTFDGQPTVRAVRAGAPGGAGGSRARTCSAWWMTSTTRRWRRRWCRPRSTSAASPSTRCWSATCSAPPGVVAVQEVESQKVLQDLAFRIHADEPAVTYTPFVVEGNDIGGIDVGYLVRQGGGLQSTTVEQVGKTSTFTFNNTVYATFDRPPLVLHFSYCPPGTPVTCPSIPLTVVNVHLRSLSGIEGSSADFVRAKRFEGARWLGPSTCRACRPPTPRPTCSSSATSTPSSSPTGGWT